MRILIDLKSQADVAYDTTYHHKLRGRIWKTLDGTKFSTDHDSNDHPGFVFSNIFPWGDISEGEDRQLIISSPNEAILAKISQNLLSNREFNVGDMPFRVEKLRSVEVDVGEPGTRGVIETDTGVLVRLYDHHVEKYDIDIPEESDDPVTYWRPEHTLEPFIDAIEENAQGKYELFGPNYLPGPSEYEGQLFEGYDLSKTFAIPLEVTTGVTRTVILSKWRLNYNVRDDDHRRHLNLLLDCGLGGRNGLGLGFLNIKHKNPVHKQGGDAHAHAF